MALAKCPVCEKEISEFSANCVNCGTELKRCPECGSLSRIRAILCKNCGYKFPVEQTEDSRADVEPDAALAEQTPADCAQEEKSAESPTAEGQEEKASESQPVLNKNDEENAVAQESDVKNAAPAPTPISAIPTADSQKPTTLESAVEKWREESKGVSVVKTVSTVLTILTLCITVPIAFLIGWRVFNIFSAFESASLIDPAVMELIPYLMPAFVVLYSVMFLINYPSTILRIIANAAPVGSFQKWILARNIDIHALNKDVLGRGAAGCDKKSMKQHVKTVSLGLNAEYYSAKGFNATKRSIVFCIVSFILSIVILALMIAPIFFYPKFDELITPIISPYISSWGIDLLDTFTAAILKSLKSLVYYLVIYVALWVLTPFVKLIQRKVFDDRPKKLRKWVYEKYPEDKAIFDSIYSSSKNSFAVINRKGLF